MPNPTEAHEREAREILKRERLSGARHNVAWLSQALATAEARGRKAGLEEAAQIAENEVRRRDNGCLCYDNPDCTCDWIGGAIEEVRDEIRALKGGDDE